MPDSTAPADPRRTAIIVASALFMQNLDSTAIATALPAMARDFGADPLHMSAAITAYLVALTVFIPVSGWVADRFGARRVFMLAIATFTIASALSALTQNLPQLVAARILQGLGGAMMVPVGRLLLLRRIDKSQLLTAMTWLTMPALIGPISGPILGGLLTDTISWRAVFLINLPIGALGLLLVCRYIAPLEPTNPGPPDIAGLLLTGAALTLLMLGLETTGRFVLPRFLPESAIAAGAITAGLAWRRAGRVPRPAIDTALFGLPSFRIATIAGFIFRTGAGTIPFLVALTLQVGFGRSATESGLVAFASALGAFGMKPMTRLVLRGLGFRRTLLWNGLVAASFIAACALFRPAWPVAAMFAVLLAGGLARSLQFTTLNTLTFLDVPAARLSAATSLHGTAQQLSAALGVATASAVLYASVALAEREGPGLWDFSIAFSAAGLLAALGALFCGRLAAGVGAEVSGHRGRAS